MGMFSQFGEIEEQSILKDSDGNSKGSYDLELLKQAWF